MGEAVRTAVKAPETKKQNQVSKVQKGNFNQSPSSPVEQILFLQRTVGNQAVQRLMKSGALQAKLRIGAPGDVYEQEADRVADAVMRMTEPRASKNTTVSGQALGTLIQCRCPKYTYRRQEEDEDVLQPKEVSGSTPEVSPGLETDINAIRGGGQPLPESVRAFFEPRFGHDFSGVHVHTGAEAAEAARAVNAKAFTLGRDVVFGDGQYTPETTEGKRLIGHELTHVVQQDHSPCAPTIIARTPLNVAEIKKDIDDGMRTPPELYSWLHVEGERSGEVGYGATRPAGSSPDKAPVNTDPGLPIRAFFFPSYIRHHDQRALILGGFHGTESPGFEIADALISELQTASGPAANDLYFHTLIIPRVNPGGIADNSRCNRQVVDLNRNLPIPGVSPQPSAPCPNTPIAPIQPETQAVIDVINQFQPHRILSLHAISSSSQAGIFADPSKHQAARQLACSLAGLVVNPSNRLGNRLTPTSCNPVYPGSSTGGTSLGSYAPTMSIPGQTVPVITLEVPGYGSLGTSGTRTVEAFLRPVRGFISDPAALANRADLDIVRDIQAFNQPLRRLFLTGRMPDSNDIYRRIRERIEAKTAELNALKPSNIPRITKSSYYRGFGQPTSGSRGQAHIIFEKFTLTGSSRKGWDTLPDKYFISSTRSKGVDRKKWLSEASAVRLDIILRYSALPGASRHHWGTDIDFNSTANADWEPPSGTKRAGKLYDLGIWLQQNAPRVGFIQAYTAGRTGGHAEEPWHYSYAPIAVPLRQMYNIDIRYSEDVIDPVIDFFNRQAAAKGITLPGDLRAALENLGISQYVNIIGPGL